MEIFAFSYEETVVPFLFSSQVFTEHAILTECFIFGVVLLVVGSLFFVCLCFGGEEKHTLRTYTWLCTQGWPLVGIGNLYVVVGFDLGFSSTQGIALSIPVSMQPPFLYFSFFFFWGGREGLFLFCFGSIPDGVQGLFLVLYPGFTHGSLEDRVGCWDFNWGSTCATEVHPTWCTVSPAPCLFGGPMFSITSDNCMTGFIFNL